MKSSTLSIISLVAMVTLSGCGSKPEQNAANQAPTATVPSATPPAGAPAAVTPDPTQPATARSVAPATQSAARAPAAPAPEPVKPPPPPPPKKYVVAAGTPISVRTISDVSTKTNASGTSFEATLASPLVVDGHTLAKTGSTVTGTVVSADKGGKVKGKAMITLSLSRLHLANGSAATIQTNTVSKEAKSGTKKNMMRTGIATGAGALIGGLAGGGKGAAIGAGVGAGAGVATNAATRGPAADIPPETLLEFALTRDLVVTEKQR
ncbi:MAG TPA: hypothetical protein VEX68_20015 [Bryobacteraceae bacterium]|nr:hypothetical protein [Bryobacteraceae bacterium]